MILRAAWSASPADSGHVSHNRAPRNSPSMHPAMDDTEGLWSLGNAGKIPWPQCHNPMNSMRGTSEQGIMGNGQSLDPNAIRP
jgi:hypothetical protein